MKAAVLSIVGMVDCNVCLTKVRAFEADALGREAEATRRKRSRFIEFIEGVTSTRELLY